MEQGNVVVLNGASSAGKSSIAKALQEIMDAPYLHMGSDHFLPRVPQKFFAVSDSSNPVPAAYFMLVYREVAARAVDPREGRDRLRPWSAGRAADRAGRRQAAGGVRGAGSNTFHIGPPSSSYHGMHSYGVWLCDALFVYSWRIRGWLAAASLNGRRRR